MTRAFAWSKATDLDGDGLMENAAAGAGAIVQAQLWYRDPVNTSNQTTSLSDALEFAVCP